MILMHGASPCQRERFGACRICDLIDRDGPHYREDYRRLFHPEEFPAEPAPPPRPKVSAMFALPRIAPAVAPRPEPGTKGCGCGQGLA
jgi:hypothetical protein